MDAAPGAPAGSIDDTFDADDPSALAARIEETIDRQLAMFGRLDGLVERQAELVGVGPDRAAGEPAEGSGENPGGTSGDDGRRLLALLSERQSAIDELSDVAAQGEALRRAWVLSESKLPPAAAGAIRRRLEALEAIAARVMAADREHLERLRRRRDALADRLGGLRTGRSAVSAYGGAGVPRAPRFQDRSG